MRFSLTSLSATLTLVSCCALAQAQPFPRPGGEPIPSDSTATAPKDHSALRPVYTRQTVFAIPFKVDDPGGSTQRPMAVQLHVSEDGGITWRMYEQVEPGASRFTFRAPHDGDYQFFVRTLDRNGRLQPSVPPKGELRVIVDTLAPRLELAAEQSPSGEILAQWRMLDQNLRPGSLRIEYQAQGSTTWNAITVPQPLERRVETGDVTFWPGADIKNLVLRAQVIDEAGNPAIAQRELGASSGATAFHNASTRNGENASDSQRQDPWQASDDQPTSGGVRWNLNEVAARPLSQNSARVEDVGPPASAEMIPPGDRLPDLVGTGAVSTPAVDRTSPAMHPTSSPNTQRTTTPPAAIPGASSPHSVEYEELPPTAPLNDSLDRHSQPVNLPPVNDETFNGPNQPSDNPGAMTVDALKQGFAIPGTSSSNNDLSLLQATSSDRLNLDQLPQGEQARMVNSRRFEFDYEIDAVGTIAIAKIELWGTRDRGQTWSSFGVDKDNRSPMPVIVDQEGLYGFRLTVEAANGLGSTPPRSGDVPELWVAVDLTKPVVKLLEAEPQPEADFGALRIIWQVEDVRLAHNPIRISYAEQRGGGWIAIAEGLDNAGEYLWKIDRRLPDRIYIRIEAHDEAGNVGAAESTEPISIEKLRPRGHIREVRPSREADRKTTWSIVR